MASSFKQFGLRAISGEEKSLPGMFARGVAAIIEPFYAAAMTLRNHCYDRGIFASHDLGRPTISVGNITTGGTGKTPVVRWLAEQTRAGGHRPAILLRGYGSTPGGMSDEAALLDGAFGNSPETIPVQPCPLRITGAALVLAKHPEVNLFLLDDGFQHRRAKRDFNLVLISATNPFGFGHVLPRGLLREPLAGLRRADAFLITRCGQVDDAALSEIDRYLNQNHPNTPVYRCDHQHTGICLPTENQNLPMTAIAGEKVFLTAAIGDPESFRRQIEAQGCRIVGVKWFDDHHAFDPADIDSLSTAVKSANATRVITTEKDWVKLAPLVREWTMPIGVVQLSIEFRNGDAARILTQMASAISPQSKPSVLAASNHAIQSENRSN